ncbi:MAG TPA: HD domain-containing protein [Phycisphaerales bacterium]|nr:HD domain-containing protein [Phycisphaerales bacterium]
MTQLSSRPHVDLKSLPPNGFVEGIYSIINPQVGTTRAGKPYLKCLLRDATGEAAARQWTFEEGMIGQLESTGFVYVAGHSQLYNGQTQIILEDIRPVEVTDEEIARLLPTTTQDIGLMFEQLKGILQTLTHPAMKALAEAYLSDEEMMGRFKQAPAAMSMHHAWIGGLLEHTLQLMKLAEAMLPLYPKLNRDIVLMGLFLHDLGKTVELTWAKGFDYTEDGNLIGHVVRGAIWLQVKAAVAAKNSGQKMPASAVRVLQHIVLSHHGDPEFGAAKLPSTPEAVFVSILDNLDAKTQMALTAARQDDCEEEIPSGGKDFTDKVYALGTRMYKPDPLKGS